MRTADEILDEELSENMLTHLKDNQVFREWIKDAMYKYAKEYHQCEVLKLNKALVISSFCDCKGGATGRTVTEDFEHQICDTCGRIAK